MITSNAFVAGFVSVHPESMSLPEFRLSSGLNVYLNGVGAHD